MSDPVIQVENLGKICHERLQSRVEAGLDTPAQLDSAAYQVHSLYCAAEDLLKLVAKAFENSVTGVDWHRVLLLRLSQPVQGMRPALLSEVTFDVMNRLRGFLHFVRHGLDEDEPLDLSRVGSLSSNPQAA